jgi:hypothetical protein
MYHITGITLVVKDGQMSRQYFFFLPKNSFLLDYRLEEGQIKKIEFFSKR